MGIPKHVFFCIICLEVVLKGVNGGGGRDRDDDNGNDDDDDNNHTESTFVGNIC